MAVRYGDESYTGLRQFVAERQQHGLAGADSAPSYALPVDAWIMRSLNSTPVRAVLGKAMDAIVSYSFGYDLASAIVIDGRSFPDLFDVLSGCARTLGIPVPHAVARHDLAMFNAFTAGTDDYSFITISSALCQFFTPAEARFVIGHECGHIACRHAMYQTLVNVLTTATAMQLGMLGMLLAQVASVPLLAWSRRAEVTADRAGLLCCGEIEVAERALLRLVTGLADPDRVDIEDYLRRAKTAEDYHRLAQFHGLFKTHPMIPKRIVALRLFADSELYYSLSGRPRPEGAGLLSTEELNRRVQAIVKP